MRRIDGERGQHREDVRIEMLLEPSHVGLAKVGWIGEHDAGLDELGPKLPPTALLFSGEMGHALADLHQLLGGRQPVLGGVRDALAHLAPQTSDAGP